MTKRLFISLIVLAVVAALPLGALSVAVVANDAIGDKGFTDMAYAGLQKAGTDFNLKWKMFECHNDTSKYYDTLRVAAQNFDLIFVDPGYFYDKELEQVHALYPDRTFVYIDGASQLKDVVSVTFKQNEGAFLAGCLAALMTDQTQVPRINKAMIVGFVGGADMPVIRDYQTGFEQGVKYANPKVKAIVKYAGTHFDPAKGKETAYSVFQDGADVIFQAAGPTGLGILEAAKDYNFYAIGVDTDQGFQQPGSIMSSMLKRVDLAVWNTVDLAVKGTLTKGSAWSYGVANGGIGLAENEFTKKIVPPKVWSQVKAIEAKLKAGQITVESYLK